MMKLVRVWDYLMRRKPLFLVVLACFGIMIFGGRQLFLPQESHVSLSQESDPAEKLAFANDLLLKIGASDSPSLTMKLSDEFTLATITTIDQALTHDAYLRILDQAGRLVTGEYTEIHDDTPIAPKKLTAAEDGAGVAYFWIDAPKTYEVKLQPGYTIELHAMTAEFESSLDHQAAPAFKPTGDTERYLVTEGGIRKESWSEAEGEMQIYELLRRYIVAMIEDYQAKVTDEVLNNRHLDTATKTKLILAFRSLRGEDQAIYQEFIEHLRIGGVPVITYQGENEYLIGEQVDLMTLVRATDGEDGVIPATAIQLEGRVDFEKADEYEITYRATDSDGNTTELPVTITIRELDLPADTPDPAPVEPDSPDVDEPGSKPTDRDPITVLPDDDLNESEDFPRADLPSNPAMSTTVETVGGGANSTNTVDVPEVETEVPSEGVHAPSTEELDATVETVRSSREDAESDQTASVKPHRLTWQQVVLIAAGILCLAGLIRFIFDHYVR